MARSNLLNQAGNLDDVRNSIRCNWQRIKPEEIKKAIRNEKANQNRKSLIALLDSSLRRKASEIRKIKQLQPGAEVMVEIQTGSQSEWVYAEITAQTAMGPNVKTFDGREFGPCAFECIQIRAWGTLRTQKGGAHES